MMEKQAKWMRFRLYLIVAFFVLVWGLILYRALELQFLKRDKLARIAEAEAHTTIKLEGVRGEIYDRNGEKLAASLEADSIFAEANKLENPGAAAKDLAKALGLDRRALAQKLNGGGSFVWIKRQVTPDEVARVEALGFKGLGFLKESKRFYPNKLLAGHTLGFVGVDSRGLEGLELGYDDYLSGGISAWKVNRDALGRTYLDRPEGAPQEMKGAGLVLTLDRRVQYITEKALAAVVEKHKAKGGLALVVRPRTGEILASAVEPGFNPNVFGEYGQAQRRNRILTDAFDPGSTFKVFVAAAALEEGAVKPLDTFHCENGAMVVDKHTIHDHHPYGTLTVNKIIKFSSNIGAAKIAEKLGPARLHRYLTAFGFGGKSGVDFPSESSGLLRPYKRWRKLDLANLAFGQGVSVTALQITMAMAALANDGLLMKPYMVSRITDASGRVIKKTEPEAIRQVVSPQTTRQVKEMLRLVVTEGGTGTRAECPGYPSAGKTGTAQKLDRATGTYSDRKYYSVFVGFAPYENPELAILVAVDEPADQTYGGLVAAPVFKEIVEQVLPILNVPPSPPPPDPEMAEKLKAAGLKNQPQKAPAALAAAAKLNKTGLEAAAATTKDKLRPMETAALAKVRELDLVSRTRGGTDPGVMPDVVGLPMRRVLDLMSRYDVKVEFKGSGRAVWQKPTPGESLQSGQVCQVKFEPM
ncbi:MAG: penicillin-binding protein [Thermodesulfobacteriota bacterium]